MDIRKLQRAIVDGLEDVKAQDIVVFNTEALSPLFERVIIASGTSNRQTKALASSVRETVKSRGLPLLRTEGEENGEWIIVDCGQAVVHIMQPAIRQYYHLEEIWGGKSIRLKKAAVAAKGLVKASEPMEDDEEEIVEVKAAPARKPRTTATTQDKAVPRKPAARQTASRQSAAADSSTGSPASKPRSSKPRAPSAAPGSPSRATAPVRAATTRSKATGQAKTAAAPRARARKPAAG